MGTWRRQCLDGQRFYGRGYQKSAGHLKKNVKKYISNVPYGLLKKDCSGKLSIKMKKGWKIQKIEQTVNGKTKKIKNNKKINTAKGAILITVKNAKLNQIEELKLAKPNF